MQKQKQNKQIKNLQMQVSKIKKQKQQQPKKQKTKKRKNNRTRDVSGMPLAFLTKGTGNKAPSSVRIPHKEFISIVSTIDTNFNLLGSFRIQPGFQSIFPWLANVAANYEMYQFKSIRLVYEPACATTTPGYVFLTYDPDILDPDPSSTQSVMSYQHGVYGSVFSKHVLTIPASSLSRRCFVRTENQSLPTAVDLKGYDVGKFAVCYDMCPAATKLGLLHVEYVVELYSPQPRSDGYAGEFITVISSAVNAVGTIAINPNPFIFQTTVGLNSVTLPIPGNYRIYGVNGATVASPGIAFSTGVNNGSTNVIGAASASTYTNLTTTALSVISFTTINAAIYTITKMAS